jgi:hypothetical protein
MSEKASVKLSTKSWHYKLIKFILGSAAPTPWNMHNLCPYFWLLIFSMLAFPFVAPFKGLFRVFSYLLDGLASFLESSLLVPIAKNWEDSLTDMDIFQLIIWEKELNKYYESTHKKTGGVSQTEFTESWWERKYGEKLKDVNKGEYSPKFVEWYERMKSEHAALKIEEELRRMEALRKKEAQQEKIYSFQRGLDNVAKKIGDEFRSWKSIIKWTKRVVGLIITSIGLAATFFIVNFLSRGLLWLVGAWSWEVFFIVIFSLIATALFIGFIFVMDLFGKYLKAKGRKLWAVNILYYLFLAIALPFKWIFYNFLWKIVLVNLWYLLRRGAIGFKDGFIGFLGIFGEYFGASYTDYCPGIDWEEEK